MSNHANKSKQKEDVGVEQEDVAVEKEVKKRGLTIAELKRLEPANQPRPYGGDDNDDDEEDEDADGEEGDDDDYRADNYRGYDYNHDYTRSQGGTQDPDDGDGEDVRSPI